MYMLNKFKWVQTCPDLAKHLLEKGFNLLDYNGALKPQYRNLNVTNMAKHVLDCFLNISANRAISPSISPVRWISISAVYLRVLWYRKGYTQYINLDVVDP